ncbi:sugar ABC transporter ATP-binding protein [Erysipelothrix larvae]|uniref:Sugar ABC transporter ATP-binding protein n=1 Tax=Erysipelothrix larvae TaxID=1514105 RepID=A0A109UHM4_9FIRM|nr:ABC transporter ATP-binding protein [Erysipelothrix larvae]AMC94453.1 sugar ABC transporter ATP-binding protein [Erysipelothrix larvae]
MIEISSLRKVYPNGFEALKKIDLQIEEGDLVCLLGPSGCGKTTILNLIAGLLDPTEGDIKNDGESLVTKHPKDRNMSLVFQNYALYPHMTVLENVMFPLRVGKNKMSKEDAQKIAYEYMELTSITELADKKPDSMSGGQQQRVAITRALVQQPKILLLDEPLSNLDARLRLRIREEIRRLVKKIGITTIFVTHDQEEAMSISDKIVLMNDGVIQQYDEAQNLYLEPKNLFVASFIGNPGMNMIPVEYKDNNLHFEGLSIDTNKLDQSRFKEALEEGTYIIGIRPENISYDPNSSFVCDVDLIELMGKEAIVSFKLGNQHMKSLVSIEESIQENESYGFSMDLERLFIFKEDGTRVY